MRVRFRQFQQLCLLLDVIAPQDGLSFLGRILAELLEVAHLGECVLDEVLKRVAECG